MKRSVSCWGPPFPLIMCLTALFACLSLPGSYVRGADTTGSSVILLSEKEEMAMGKLIFGQVLAESTLSTDPQVLEEVSAVGKRLAEVAGRSHFQWEFQVIWG